jgi:hypothetical protein
MRTIFNVIGTQIGWFACAIGAAKGMPWIGLVAVAIYLALYLYWSENRAGELRLMFLVGVIGMVIDSLNKTFGLLHYAGDSLAIAWLAPLWIVALWLEFATMLNTSLVWLQGRYFIAAVMGAICGPLSYLGGVRLGALSLLQSKTFTVVMLGIIWGMAVPSLTWLAKRLAR